MFSKPTTWKSKKWRDAARDQCCTMRLPCCNGDWSTTVLAHKGGAGMGMKADDHNACDCCAACHDALDGRTKVFLSNGEQIDKGRMLLYFEEARVETIVNRLERGIVK